MNRLGWFTVVSIDGSTKHASVNHLMVCMQYVCGIKRGRSMFAAAHARAIICSVIKQAISSSKSGYFMGSSKNAGASHGDSHMKYRYMMV